MFINSNRTFSSSEASLHCNNASVWIIKIVLFKYKHKGSIQQTKNQLKDLNLYVCILLLIPKETTKTGVGI